MFPVLFSIGNFSVSTFGIFLALSFLYAIFLVWRLARAWELDEERVLDLTLVTFMGGLIGARLYYVVTNPSFFGIENPAFGFDFLKILLIHKYPGFSFWGGLGGGFLTLALFARKVKIDFWQAADFASVGLLGGLIISNIGCLLGGCSVGIQSNLFFAIPVVGLLGKRIPVQLIEALLLFILLKKVWSIAIHFHPRGQIISVSLIFIGIIKILSEPLKQVKEELYFSIILVILGLTIFYKVTKRNPQQDFKGIILFPARFFSDSHLRREVMSSVKKSWYNQKVSINLNFRNLFKKVRSLNVRFSHKNSKYY